MDFRTIVTPAESAFRVDYRSRIVMLGSCFSDTISERLDKLFFEVCSNPLGTLYNPASIADTIERIACRRLISPDELIESEGRFHSFACHSSLSNESRAEMASNANDRICSAHNFLTEATHLFLTFGTAWVFRLVGDNSIVANCHKLPPAMFSRTRLTVDECCNEIRRTIKSVKNINPDINITLTVSPIRHLSDGANGNALSKSTLLLACDEICRTEPSVEYFPAYEIMTDDLRDYRFYSTDMCHPTDFAADYIFEKFDETYFSEQTRSLAKQCRKLRKRLDHRHLTTDKETIARFNSSTAALIIQLIAEEAALGPRLSEYSILRK